MQFLPYDILYDLFSYIPNPSLDLAFINNDWYNLLKQHVATKSLADFIVGDWKNGYGVKIQNITIPDLILSHFDQSPNKRIDLVNTLGTWIYTLEPSIAKYYSKPALLSSTPIFLERWIHMTDSDGNTTAVEIFTKEWKNYFENIKNILYNIFPLYKLIGIDTSPYNITILWSWDYTMENFIMKFKWADIEDSKKMYILKYAKDWLSFTPLWENSEIVSYRFNSRIWIDTEKILAFIEDRDPHKCPSWNILDKIEYQRLIPSK